VRGEAFNIIDAKLLAYGRWALRTGKEFVQRQLTVAVHVASGKALAAVAIRDELALVNEAIVIGVEPRKRPRRSIRVAVGVPQSVAGISGLARLLVSGCHGLCGVLACHAWFWSSWIHAAPTACHHHCNAKKYGEISHDLPSSVGVTGASTPLRRAQDRQMSVNFSRNHGRERTGKTHPKQRMTQDPNRGQFPQKAEILVCGLGLGGLGGGPPSTAKCG